MKNKLEPGIYCIRNKTNFKCYVGHAQYVARRLYEHKYHLERNSDKATALQRAVNKYGLDNFEFTVLEMCSLDVINDREIWWIAELDSHNKNHGYNLSTGGESGLRGYKFPPEFGAKVSASKLAQHKVLTDEHKQKISIAQKGKKKPEGMGAKLSASISGAKHHMWGKQHTEESKRKMKEAKERNPMNGRKLKGAASKYHGVYKSTSSKNKSLIYWTSCVRLPNSKRIYIGQSRDEEAAARMYDAYVRENNLPHPLNFPIGE